MSDKILEKICERFLNESELNDAVHDFYNDLKFMHTKDDFKEFIKVMKNKLENIDEEFEKELDALINDDERIERMWNRVNNTTQDVFEKDIKEEVEKVLSEKKLREKILKSFNDDFNFKKYIQKSKLEEFDEKINKLRELANDLFASISDITKDIIENYNKDEEE